MAWKYIFIALTPHFTEMVTEIHIGSLFTEGGKVLFTPVTIPSLIYYTTPSGETWTTKWHSECGEDANTDETVLLWELNNLPTGCCRDRKTGSP